MACGSVLHSITPYDFSSTDSQMDTPEESTISVDAPAPGTTAVIKVPPIEPVLGETETSFGVRVNSA